MCIQWLAFFFLSYSCFLFIWKTSPSRLGCVLFGRGRSTSGCVNFVVHSRSVFYFVIAVLVVAGCQNSVLQPCTRILASVHNQVNCPRSNSPGFYLVWYLFWGGGGVEIWTSLLDWPVNSSRRWCFVDFWGVFWECYFALVYITMYSTFTAAVYCQGTTATL